MLHCTLDRVLRLDSTYLYERLSHELLEIILVNLFSIRHHSSRLVLCVVVVSIYFGISNASRYD